MIFFSNKNMFSHARFMVTGVSSDLKKTDKPYFGKITTGNFISLIKIVVFEWDKIPSDV